MCCDCFRYGNPSQQDGDGDSSTLDGSAEDNLSVVDVKANFTKLTSEEWLETVRKRGPGAPVSSVAYARSEKPVSNATNKGASKLTRQNVQAHDCAHAPLLKGSPRLGDDESSVYSIDQDGFYTSMHRDCGIMSKRYSNIQELDEEAESVTSVSTVTSTNNGETKTRKIKFPSLRRKKRTKVPPPPPPRISTLSQSTANRGSGMVEPSQRNKEELERLKAVASQMAAAKDAAMEKSSSVGGDFISESDTDSLYGRVMKKSSISSAAIPALCSVTPVNSDEEDSDMLGFNSTWRPRPPSADIHDNLLATCDDSRVNTISEHLHGPDINTAAPGQSGNSYSTWPRKRAGASKSKPKDGGWPAPPSRTRPPTILPQRMFTDDDEALQSRPVLPEARTPDGILDTRTFSSAIDNTFKGSEVLSVYVQPEPSAESSKATKQIFNLPSPSLLSTVTEESLTPPTTRILFTAPADTQSQTTPTDQEGKKPQSKFTFSVPISSLDKSTKAPHAECVAVSSMDTPGPHKTVPVLDVLKGKVPELSDLRKKGSKAQSKAQKQKDKLAPTDPIPVTTSDTKKEDSANSSWKTSTWPRRKKSVSFCASILKSKDDFEVLETVIENGQARREITIPFTNTFPRSKDKSHFVSPPRPAVPNSLPITAASTGVAPQAASAKLVISSPVANKANFVDNPYRRAMCSPVTEDDLAKYSSYNSSDKWYNTLPRKGSPVAQSPGAKSLSIPTSPDPTINVPKSATMFEFPTPPDPDIVGDTGSGDTLRKPSQPIFPSIAAMKHSVSFPIPKGKEKEIDPSTYGRSWYEEGVTLGKVIIMPDTKNVSTNAGVTEASFSFASVKSGHPRLSFTSFLREQAAAEVHHAEYAYRRNSNASTISSNSTSSGKKSVTFASVHHSSYSSLSRASDTTSLNSDITSTTADLHSCSGSTSEESGIHPLCDRNMKRSSSLSGSDCRSGLETIIGSDSECPPPYEEVSESNLSQQIHMPLQKPSEPSSKRQRVTPPRSSSQQQQQPLQTTFNSRLRTKSRPSPSRSFPNQANTSVADSTNVSHPLVVCPNSSSAPATAGSVPEAIISIAKSKPVLHKATPSPQREVASAPKKPVEAKYFIAANSKGPSALPVRSTKPDSSKLQTEYSFPRRTAPQNPPVGKHPPHSEKLNRPAGDNATKSAVKAAAESDKNGAASNVQNKKVAPFPWKSTRQPELKPKITSSSPSQPTTSVSATESKPGPAAPTFVVQPPKKWSPSSFKSPLRSVSSAVRSVVKDSKVEGRTSGVQSPTTATVVSSSSTGAPTVPKAGTSAASPTVSKENSPPTPTHSHDNVFPAEAAPAAATPDLSSSCCSSRRSSVTSTSESCASAASGGSVIFLGDKSASLPRGVPSTPEGALPAGASASSPPTHHDKRSLSGSDHSDGDKSSHVKYRPKLTLRTSLPDTSDKSGSGSRQSSASPDDHDDKRKDRLYRWSMADSSLVDIPTVLSSNLVGGLSVSSGNLYRSTDSLASNTSLSSYAERTRSAKLSFLSTEDLTAVSNQSSIDKKFAQHKKKLSSSQSSLVNLVQKEPKALSTRTTAVGASDNNNLKDWRNATKTDKSSTRPRASSAEESNSSSSHKCPQSPIYPNVQGKFVSSVLGQLQKKGLTDSPSPPQTQRSHHTVTSVS